MHLLNLKEVIYQTGLRRSSIYKFMDEGHFPKSVSIGGRSVMWLESDIQKWIKGKVSARHLNLRSFEPGKKGELTPKQTKL